MELYFSALQVSLAYGLMSLGIFITLRIFRLPDITTDGSFTCGAAVYALGMQDMNGSLPLFLLLAFLAGSAGGFCTGWITEKLRIKPLISGILVMSALYSINLLLMGKSNISIPLSEEALSPFYTWLTPSLVLCLALGALAFLLHSDYGLAMRATGHAEQMAMAHGIRPGHMRIAGLMLANGLTALSGAMVARFQGFTDINMGVGIVIAGLGSVMISESILQALGVKKLWLRLLFLVPATMLFRLILAFSLSMGVDPVLLKLVSSFLVLCVMSIPLLTRKPA